MKRLNIGDLHTEGGMLRNQRLTIRRRRLAAPRSELVGAEMLAARIGRRPLVRKPAESPESENECGRLDSPGRAQRSIVRCLVLRYLVALGDALLLPALG